MTSQAYQGNDASAMYYKKVDMDCQLSGPWKSIRPNFSGNSEEWKEEKIKDFETWAKCL